MDLLTQDVRYAVRRLAASPLFALMAILIVGVGIAANTTVFSVVNAVLLRPLPFANADASCTSIRTRTKARRSRVRFPAYRAIAERRDVFARAAAVFNTTVTAGDRLGGQTVVCRVRERVVLSCARPEASQAVGLSPEEDGAASPRRPSSANTPGARASALIRTCLAAPCGSVDRRSRSSASGREDYNGIVNGTAVDFWLPLAALGPVAGSFAAQTLERPQDHWFLIRARLRDGVSIEQARAAMAGVSNDLAGRFAGLDQKRRIAVLPAQAVRIHPSSDGTLVPAAVLLMTVVGLVLVLVCSNLAILCCCAARYSIAPCRFGWRWAPDGPALCGSSSPRVSSCLSLAGSWRRRRAVACAVPVEDRSAGAVWLDGRLDRLPRAGVVTALSLITGVAFGSGTCVARDAHGHDRAIVGVASMKRHVGVKYGMVGFQVALSLVLLAGTGLVIRSMMQMERVDIGFNRDRLTFVTTSAFQAGYTPPNAARVYRDIADRLTAVPGVQSV
jgi:hypothetical protein